ncbi:hypothetical protein CPB86DRAFT_800331 [Serendipita vermifera]|nr:hypothetical protein CPB86DRAFT_800331 [Serendipita vermifera]
MEADQTKLANPTEKTTQERTPGRSLFPIARVQKILKADKELNGVAKEAVFLIAIATERFIARVSEAARSQASREKRATVQKKDILAVTRRDDEYFFLAGILEDPGALKSSMKKAFGVVRKEPADEDDAALSTALAEPQAGSASPSERDDMQSEGVSLPPSSRPSTPLSLGDSQPEPIEDEMEEED